VTQCGCAATSSGGEATSGRKKGGDNASCAEANLAGPKTEENPCGQVSCYKWTVKI
jgi:hypothetical protein